MAFPITATGNAPCPATIAYGGIIPRPISLHPFQKSAIICSKPFPTDCLNSRIGFIKGMGRSATWVIPVVLGAATVANAPPELRVRTAVEESGGIILAGVATTIVTVGTKALASAAIGLSLTPAGWFAVALIGGAIVGAVAYEYGKRWTGNTYQLFTESKPVNVQKVPDLLMKCH